MQHKDQETNEEKMQPLTGEKIKKKNILHQKL